MIIWKGFGILVGIVGAAAILLGSVVASSIGFGGLSGAAGMGLAAVANWGLWKMIYPKNPQVLIDPTSGRQFLKQANHSLFFIPARAWTWIFAALALPVGGMGIMASSADEVVFICHVPELRNYKSEDSKSALADIAWGSAKAAAQLLDPTAEKTLTVGLRGISTYGILLKGQTGGDEPARSGSFEKVAILFPGFSKPAVSVSAPLPATSPADSLEVPADALPE